MPSAAGSDLIKESSYLLKVLSPCSLFCQLIVASGLFSHKEALPDVMPGET